MFGGRCVLALLVLGAVSLKSRKSLDTSGLVASWVVGLPVALLSWPLFAALLTFFLVGSKATKIGADAKRLFEADYDKASKRNAFQVGHT